MKTAKELYNITQNSVPRIVNDILCGVKEHIIKRCEEEANRGKGHYTIYLKRGLQLQFMAWIGKDLNGVDLRLNTSNLEKKWQPNMLMK